MKFNSASSGRSPRGRRPSRLTAGRMGLYAFVVTAALVFLLPFWVMVTTSLKPMSEIRTGNIFAPPLAPSFDAWVAAWSSACTGLQCEGVSVGFVNSVIILIPSLILSLLFGAVNGYALSLWRVRGANILFGILLFGAFIPHQLVLYPIVRVFAALGIYGTVWAVIVIHVVFAQPVMTLVFRNYYASLPAELFKAARVDGAGFWRMFFAIVLPMSTPILVVAAILQVTAIWNDFLYGLVFAGRDSMPMTVQLNNIIHTTTGERFYNVEMAATLMTAALPLLVYLVSGRLFVRGIAAGALKG